MINLHLNGNLFEQQTTMTRGKFTHPLSLSDRVSEKKEGEGRTSLAAEGGEMACLRLKAAVEYCYGTGVISFLSMNAIIAMRFKIVIEE
jgi:hypothetical protein